MSRRPIRKRYLVQRELQGQFIALFCLLALLGGAATGVATGIVAHRTLGQAMFRGHFVEWSTGQIVLPVLLKVNAIGAGAVALCGLAAAVYLFRREAKTLDELCAWLAAWSRELTPASSGMTTPQAALSRGWASDLQRAFCDADGALRATYRHAADQASELRAAAHRIEDALRREKQTGDLARHLEAAGQRIEDIEAALARHQSEGTE